jgi:hypothetical protein
MRVHFSKSDDPAKKYKVVVESADRKKTIHFGAAGMKDYTKHSTLEREARKRAYIARHSATEDWNDPFTAGFWSKHILWNKPTVEASLASTLSRFNMTRV